MKQSVRTTNHSKKGRFIKGNNANPKGNNQFTSLVPLIEALKRAGDKRDEDFWDMVANRTWQHESVLIAILRKILPEKLEHSGEIKGQKILNINIQQLNEKSEQELIDVFRRTIPQESKR